jgi:hypothetical protein
MPVIEGYLTLTALTAAVCAAIFWARSSRFRSVDVPPGPPMTDWLSGHAAILPLKKPWKVYTEWAHKYGMSNSGQIRGGDLKGS